MTAKKLDVKTRRLDELDYLKCVMIVLVVSFHLVFIGDSYPYAKKFVYTFHMPVFFIISGYMICKDNVSITLRKLLWHLIPYLVLEGVYIVTASFVPIREHINELNVETFITKILIHPIGPYWYLHTLIICGTVHVAINRLFHVKLMSNLILTSIVFALMAETGILPLTMSFYFLAGVVIRYSNVGILQIFQPSWIALFGIVLLAAHPENLNAGSAGGILMVYLVMSFLLSTYSIQNHKVHQCTTFIGRHTLEIFLFSPIFTLLCKFILPLFSFDQSGTIFLIISLCICISGSMLIAKVLDCLGLSKLLFGKNRFN